MAQFFFDIELDGRIIKDPDGQDLPDAYAARDAAVKSIREIVSNRIAGGSPANHGRIIVVDAGHRQVLEVSFADAVGLK